MDQGGLRRGDRESGGHAGVCGCRLRADPAFAEGDRALRLTDDLHTRFLTSGKPWINSYLEPSFEIEVPPGHTYGPDKMQTLLDWWLCGDKSMMTDQHAEVLDVGEIPCDKPRVYVEASNESAGGLYTAVEEHNGKDKVKHGGSDWYIYWDNSVWYLNDGPATDTWVSKAAGGAAAPPGAAWTAGGRLGHEGISCNASIVESECHKIFVPNLAVQLKDRNGLDVTPKLLYSDKSTWTREG